jgi:geranylgeranyl diphosphate synthase type II
MSIDIKEIFRILEGYKSQIENKIEKDLLENFGPSTVLKEACAYSLLNGGKRFRPAIVLMVAKALGKNFDVLDAAIAVEYFHTASLIADDMPCMDNDDERRGRPSLHKAFNETTALLASYALISAGYRAITQNSEKGDKNPENLRLALDITAYNTGILGATGGQFLDIFPSDKTVETLLEILNKKTVTLFEIAFCLGWIFGGGDLNKLDLVKRLAYHFGMAFQIADDLDDLKQDEKQEQSVNLAKVIGVKQATDVLAKEKSSLLQVAKELSLDSKDFLALVNTMG